MKTLFTTVLLFFTVFTYGQKVKLQIYGGKDHDVYLGCLNCSNYDENSIWNAYGKYGNSYNAISIWNKYGTYGNSYNSLSPFNEYSNTPPVIVDKEGNFYGYFTVNESKSKRSTLDLSLIICKYWAKIGDDVGSWYSKIFE
jgi:hypothetical protein